jgi:DNA invertase Pin-like site-specific DNA recombinase
MNMDKIRAAVYMRFANYTNTAFYCRVAHADADAMEQQENALVSFAEVSDYGSYTRFGKTGEHLFYRDNGESGLTLDRPEMNRLMSDIRAGRINTVIVKDTSRIARNFLLIGEWLGFLKEHDVKLITMYEGIID